MSTEPIKNNLADEAIKVLEQIAYDSPFNPFKVMRNGDHEIRHSNTLAWLFDSKDNHGLGNKFAVRFFSEIFKDVDWNNKFNGEISIETEVAANPYYFNTYKKEHEDKYNENEKRKDEKFGKEKGKKKKADDESKPEKEKSDNNKKIDIFIKGKDFTITIENKYGSGEHDWQCQRYRFDRDKKYSKDAGYTNYYIFLDIEEPDDWWIGKNSEYENLRYEGYKLITYETVSAILKELIKNKDERLDAVKFIRNYISVLDENYGTFNPTTEKLIINGLPLGETIHELKELNSKLENSKKTFEKYSNNLQLNENEPLVRDTLNKLVKDECQKDKYQNGKNVEYKRLINGSNENLIHYHFGKAGVSDPYAYKLEFKDYTNDNEKVNQIKKTVNNYINEIDYKAKYGCYSIAIFYGLGVDHSRNWCNYLANDEQKNEFIKKLRVMNKEWDIMIRYDILNGRGAEGEAIKVFPFDDTDGILGKIKDCSKDEIDNSIRQEKKTVLINSKTGKVDENSAVLIMAKKLLPEKYEEIKSTIEEYFNKDNNAMTFRLVLKLEYKTGVIITDEDREKIRPELGKLFYEKTREGLNLFGLGDSFVKTIFNKPENCE